MLKAPPNERKQPRTITLPQHLWDFAKEVGDGNTSKGVRYILESVRLQNQEPSANQPPQGSL